MMVLQAAIGRISVFMTFAGSVAILGFGCSAPRSGPLLAPEELYTPTPSPFDTPAPPTPTPAAGEAQQPPDIFGFDYKGLVRFAQWDDKGLELENFIAGYPIVQGYIYGVEMVGLPQAEYRSALEKGEIDVVVEMSRAASPDWYKKVTESGTVLDVGSLFGDDSDLRIGVHSGLKERAPEIVELLRRMTPGKETLKELKARLTGGRVGVRPNVAALVFFKQHEDKWTQWMPPVAVAGVKAAIGENRSSLHRKCLQVPGEQAFYCK